MPQSLAKIYVHLVFSTKGRTDTLPKSNLADIHAYIAEILSANHCPAIIIGGTTNHIHLLFVLSKTIALSDVVRIIKSNSSKWIHQHQSKLSCFAWQDGYGAFSISQNHVDAVKQYIAGQEMHHAKTSFQDEFRRLCKIYDVDINEQYCWN